MKKIVIVVTILSLLASPLCAGILVTDKNGQLVSVTTLSRFCSETQYTGTTARITSNLDPAMSNYSSAGGCPVDRGIDIAEAGALGNTTDLKIYGRFNAPNKKVFNGAGAVRFGPNSAPEISAAWWGWSPTASATVNTSALTSAVAAPIQSSYGSGAFESGSVAVGNAPWVTLGIGAYNINGEIPYGLYSRIKGDNTIIFQNNSSSKIFTSTTPYKNTFKGITFIGGQTHIYAKNYASPPNGLEGVKIEIDDCEFQTSRSYAVQFLKSGAAGGEMGTVYNSKFMHTGLSLKTQFDITSVKDVWDEPHTDYYWPSDTARIYNSGQIHLDNYSGVPDGTLTGTTMRWIDNYGSVAAYRCRFGGEGGGGMPAVYNFTDALSTTTYPYFGYYGVSIKESTITCNAGVSGAVVLKSGLPHLIAIENNIGLSSGAYINTTNMSGGTNLSAYLAGIGADQPTISIRIKNNTGRVSITSTEAATLALSAWMEYDNPGPLAITRNIRSNYPVVQTYATVTAMGTWDFFTPVVGQSYVINIFSPTTGLDLSFIEYAFVEANGTIRLKEIAATAGWTVTVASGKLRLTSGSGSDQVVNASITRLY